MYEGKFPHKRYKLTLEFLKKHISENHAYLRFRGFKSIFQNYEGQRLSG